MLPELHVGRLSIQSYTLCCKNVINVNSMDFKKNFLHTVTVLYKFVYLHCTVRLNGALYVSPSLFNAEHAYWPADFCLISLRVKIWSNGKTPPESLYRTKWACKQQHDPCSHFFRDFFYYSILHFLTAM